MTHFGIEESQRQLMIRALAVQALIHRGLKDASREAAVALYGGKMFDDLIRNLEDIVKPVIQT